MLCFLLDTLEKLGGQRLGHVNRTRLVLASGKLQALQVKVGQEKIVKRKLISEISLE